MRARHRHFNPKAAGADLVLDSRYLTASNNDAIQTWTSRSGTNDASQATAAARPTYNVNMSGGQPALRFDGGDSMGFAGNLISGTPDGFAAFVYKVDNDPASGANSGVKAGPVLGEFGSASDANHWPWSDGNIYDDFGSTVRKTVGNPTPSLTSFRIISQHSAANDFAVNIDGSQFYSTSTNTVGWSGAQQIGFSALAPSFNYFLLGHIAFVVFAPLKPAASLRKRIEHSAAFSFKISCN